MWTYRNVCGIPDTIEVTNSTHIFRKFLWFWPLKVVYDGNDVAV
jgi:hypothetical protein